MNTHIYSTDGLDEMTTINTTDWIRPEICKLSAYHVPDATGMVKLDAMENPYTWSDELIAAWQEKISHAPINRYPDPSAESVKKSLRDTFNVPECADIVLGNGSDELIQMLILCLNHNDNIVLAPEPSFVMYKMLADIVGMRYVGVPLQPHDFSLDIFAFLEAIETYHPAVIFLAYPNNPTGNAFSTSDIEMILQSTEGLVVIDEAYEAFAEESFMQKIEEYPNLLVMRTVSKLGLAGLRLGFLAGHPDWMNEIEKTRLPYNINVLTQISAEFALQHYPVFEAQTAKICAERSVLSDALAGLAGVEVWDSQANFLLFRIDNARTIFDGLKEKGILIKCLDGGHSSLSNCLRVTVGTPEENQAFIKALTSLI